MFVPDNFIQGTTNSDNNWSKGMYTVGPEEIDSVMDQVRRQTENCDSLQGFEINHSIGGGTGSGMGSLILQRLKDTYPDKFIMHHPILPNNQCSDQIVQPYNVVLSMHHIIESPDVSIIYDN